jgi:toxin YhaV
MASEYLLRYHVFYAQRVAKLKERVKALKEKLPPDEFQQHDVVKLAYRIRQADQEIIPKDPDRPEYRLTGDLRKYRRYKQGLQRYRLMFCFSSSPKVIVYLYINDEDHLRKYGDKNDPYTEFKKLLTRGHFSHNPADPHIQKWLQTFHW